MPDMKTLTIDGITYNINDNNLNNLLDGSSTGSLHSINSDESSSYTIGQYAVALGGDVKAGGNFSTALNLGTVSAGNSQTAIGKYNTIDSNNTSAFIIGNGTADNARSNALTVDWNGNLFTGSKTAWNAGTGCYIGADGTMSLQRGTTSSNAYNSSNPCITFLNSDASQNIQLIYTDFDAIQAPASLTLVGNQGGEYFIAPNIKATSSIYLSGSLVFQGSQGDKTFSVSNNGSLTTPYEIYAGNNVIIPNASYLYSRNTSSSARIVAGINSSNDYFFGYGGYSNNEGTTYFDGNIVSVRSKNSITITSDTNDVKILGTQMYKYQTATLSANTTYLSACSVTVHRWLNLVMIVGNITHKAVSTPSSANLFSAALNNLYKPRGEVYVMDSIGSYKYKITTSGNFSLVSTTTTTAGTHYFCITYMAQTGS